MYNKILVFYQYRKRRKVLLFVLPSLFFVRFLLRTYIIISVKIRSRCEFSTATCDANRFESLGFVSGIKLVNSANGMVNHKFSYSRISKAVIILISAGKTDRNFGGRNQPRWRIHEYKADTIQFYECR